MDIFKNSYVKLSHVLLCIIYVSFKHFTVEQILSFISLIHRAQCKSLCTPGTVKHMPLLSVLCLTDAPLVMDRA